MVQLQECQVLIDNKEKLMEKCRRIEVMLWKQKIQEKEMEVKGFEKILELKKREAEVDKARAEFGRQMEKLEAGKKLDVPPAEEVDSITKTRRWLQGGTSSVQAILVMELDREVEVRYAGGVTSAQMRSRQKVKSDDKISMTPSQKRIAELEAQLMQANQQLKQNSHSAGAAKMTGLSKLERLGLLPASQEDRQ